MRRACRRATVVSMLIAMPTVAAAQINVAKTDYCVPMGDSVAAGEGAMPVATGYLHRLYEQAAFGSKQQTDFANIGLRGARSWQLRDHDSASQGREGLPSIERRVGYASAVDFDIHPTNLGHSFIAREFKAVWDSLP